MDGVVVLVRLDSQSIAEPLAYSLSNRFDKKEKESERARESKRDRDIL